MTDQEIQEMLTEIIVDYCNMKEKSYFIKIDNLIPIVKKHLEKHKKKEYLESITNKECNKGIISFSTNHDFHC